MSNRRLPILCLALLYMVYRSDTRRITYPPPKMQHPYKIRRYTIANIARMTQEILKDANTKMVHIEKYVDMYRGKPSFEMGAAAGEMYSRFKKMVTMYKESTKMHDNKPWNYRDHNGYKVWNDNIIEALISAFQVMHGEYNEILYLRKVFYETIEKAHAARREKINKLKTQRSKTKTQAPSRRNIESQVENLDSLRLHTKYESDTESQRRSENLVSLEGKSRDVYVDYWGHVLDRNEEKLKMKARNHDRFDDAFSEDLDKKFAHIFNRNNSAATAHFANETFKMIANQEKRKEKINRMIEENEKRNQERAATRVSDDEYKRLLRLQSFERRRANFSPEREGVEVDLADLM